MKKIENELQILPTILELTVDLYYSSSEVDNIVVGNFEKIVSSLGFNKKIDDDKENKKISLPYVYSNDKNGFENIFCRIAPGKFSLSWSKDPNDFQNSFYPGWDEHLSKIFSKILKKIDAIQINDLSFNKIEYKVLDFFDDNKNIFSDTNIALNVNGAAEYKLQQVSLYKDKDSIKNKITLANNVRIFSNQRSIKIVGAVVDTSTSFKIIKKDNKKLNLMDIVEKCHKTNKEIFFEIINKKYKSAKE